MHLTKWYDRSDETIEAEITACLRQSSKKEKCAPRRRSRKPAIVETG
jgi:hypothetical protein